MFNLTKQRAWIADPANEHDVELRRATHMHQGLIYIGIRAEGAQAPEPQLENDKKVVLRTAQGQHSSTLELTTSAQCDDNPTATGAYLNQADYNSLPYHTQPSLRLYTWGDIFRKIRSGPGLALLLPALLALLTASVGAIFIALSHGQPPVTSIADQAQTIVAWVAPPGSIRAVKGAVCLQLMEGHQLPAVTIPGVHCAPPSVPWWRSSLTGPLLVGVIAIITALIGIFVLYPRYYAFGKSPATKN
jgi:hypothetical protein